jgi:hypothetical protein
MHDELIDLWAIAQREISQGEDELHVLIDL